MVEFGKLLDDGAEEAAVYEIWCVTGLTAETLEKFQTIFVPALPITGEDVRILKMSPGCGQLVWQVRVCA